MNYLFAYLLVAWLYNLTDFVMFGLNSTTVLELTVSAGKLFHTVIFLKANEFNLTGFFALS